MDVDAFFTDPDPLGTPDVVVDAGERWECPCGYFASGPVSFSHPGFSSQAQCPHCQTIVEHVGEGAQQ